LVLKSTMGDKVLMRLPLPLLQLARLWESGMIPERMTLVVVSQGSWVLRRPLLVLVSKRAPHRKRELPSLQSERIRAKCDFACWALLFLTPIFPIVDASRLCTSSMVGSCSSGLLKWSSASYIGHVDCSSLVQETSKLIRSLSSTQLLCRALSPPSFPPYCSSTLCNTGEFSTWSAARKKHKILGINHT
jgi:hypothetical protein